MAKSIFSWCSNTIPKTIFRSESEVAAGWTDNEDEVKKGGWLKEGPQARARRRGHFILTSSDDKTCSETSAWRRQGVKVFTKSYPESLRERLVLRWFHVSNRVPRYQSPMISVAPHIFAAEKCLRISRRSFEIWYNEVKRETLAHWRYFNQVILDVENFSCRAYTLVGERDDRIRESSGIVYYFSRKYERQQVERT